MHALAQAWLSLQCKMISDVSQGIVILGNRLSIPLAPTASWPIGSKQHKGLSTVAEEAVSNGKGIVQSYNSDKDIIACPIMINNEVLGVVALETRSRNENGQQALLQMLHWGASWLTFILDEEKASQKDRLISTIELISTSLDQNNLSKTSMATSNELATKLACDRVSIGFKNKRNIQVSAISKTATFDQKSQLIRDIGTLMDEACDQDKLIVLPENEQASFQITIAHHKFLKHHGQKSICTIPLTNDHEHIGAIVFERTIDHPFDIETQELIKYFGQLIGPILELKRISDRGVISKFFNSCGDFITRVFGSDHLKTKLGLFLLAILTSFFFYAQAEYRISADARLEGSTKRAIVAPIEGYIDTANFSAGDLIKKGDLLAKLSDKDLQLEKQKLSAQQQQLKKEYRSELAGHDRAKIGIANIRMQQIDAQLNLIDQQLENTEIQSPFDGIIISGDLKHNLGSPVEKGQVLFEITPQNDFHIILEVDEKEISELKIMQSGQLLLSALPKEYIPFVVEKITPISEVKEGKNYFRVEAKIENEQGPLSEEISVRLRPGMQGVGKISIEERKLIWIWIHKITDWFQLWLWSWKS